MSRILLIGAGGQLGRELLHSLPPLGQLVPVDRSQLDLTDTGALDALIRQVMPHTIVNAAAYTAVDRAEQEPELAVAVNATAPAVMARTAQAIGATLVQFSTDYVFDGARSSPYTEATATAPIGVYGQSKCQGELAIQQETDRYLILRTAWVYGALGQANFVKTMLRLGGERTELRVVADQVGAPTWAADLARVTAQLLAHDLAPQDWGIYHYTNAGVASWYDLAVAIFEEARALGATFPLQRVLPITTDEYPTLAKRPPFSVLSTRKLTTLLGAAPPHWRVSLRSMLSLLYASSS